MWYLFLSCKCEIITACRELALEGYLFVVWGHSCDIRKTDSCKCGHGLVQYTVQPSESFLEIAWPRASGPTVWVVVFGKRSGYGTAHLNAGHNGQIFPTEQWHPTILFFETSALRERACNIARFSSNDSGNVEAVYISELRYCSMTQVAWFVTVCISGSCILTFWRRNYYFF
jgi:hypothetical protein